MLSPRQLCFVVGAFVILVVIFSSKSVPSAIPVTGAFPGFDQDKSQQQGTIAEDTVQPHHDAGHLQNPNPIPAVADNPPPAVAVPLSPNEKAAAVKAPPAAPHLDVPAVDSQPGALPPSKLDLPAVGASPPAPTRAHGEFDKTKWDYEKETQNYANPTWRIKNLKQYKPHNYIGPGHPVIATYLSSRNGTLHDPYFQAAQQLVYRILWDPRSKSKHPIVVYVAPYIEQDKRDVLLAAGAIVKELESVEWEPEPSVLVWGRWRDVFAKLNIWGDTDFSRVLFLDLDAFPLKPVDELLELAPQNECKKELLPKEDQPNASSICPYIFTGHNVLESTEINVGVMVIQPNTAMQQRLLREAAHTENFDNSMAEQAFLNYMFGKNSPFPPHYVDHDWNGFLPKEDEEYSLKIVHEKIWAMDDPEHWAGKAFVNTWRDMLLLYNSREFESRRRFDGKIDYDPGEDLLDV